MGTKLNTKTLICLSLFCVSLLCGCAERQDAVLPSGNVLAYLGRTPVRGVANDVTTFGNRAYVADAPYGVSIYDLSNPSSPQLVDSIFLLDNSPKLIALDATGTVLAVQAASGIQIYDLHDNRWVLNTGSSNHYKIDLRFQQDTLTIFRADRDAGDGFNVEKFVNIGTPDSLVFGPLQYFSRNDAGAYGFALDNLTNAYVCYDVMGFSILDYSTPITASLVGQLNVPGRIRDAGLTGNVLCLAAGYEGIVTVNVSNPSNPVQLGSLLIPNATDIIRVVVAGDRAYLLDDYDGIFAVDVSAPANPALIGTLVTSEPSGFSLLGDLIVVADSDEGLVVGQILY
jgi:hypothetical protein